MYMEVEGTRSRGRPRKTWLEVVKNYMTGKCEWTIMDRRAWRRKIVGICTDLGLSGAPLGFFPG